MSVYAKLYCVEPATRESPCQLHIARPIIQSYSLTCMHMTFAEIFSPPDIN